MKRNLIIAFALTGILLSACGPGEKESNVQQTSSPSNAGNPNSNTAVTDSIADSTSNNHNANRADQSGIDTTKQKP